MEPEDPASPPGPPAPPKGGPPSQDGDGPSSASGPRQGPAGGDSPLASAQLEVAEIFGGIAAFWGFTRTQGRIYGLLFLCAEPLGQTEIRDRLGISTGSASMTLASLEAWGVVLRRDGRLYEPETDLWKVITGVLRRREREQVESAIDRIARVRHVLDAIADPSPAERFAQHRAEQLEEFFALGQRFLEAFVQRSPLRGLINTIAQRAAKFRTRLTSSEHDVPYGH